MGLVDFVREKTYGVFNRSADAGYDDQIEVENYEGEYAEDSYGYESERAEPRPLATRSRERRTPRFVSEGSGGTQVLSIRANVQMQVVIAHPTALNDVADICDYIKEYKTVVINLENVEHETAQRIVDFLSGASHALNGEIQYISKKIFLFAPENVDISGDFKEELRAKGLLFSF